MGHLEIIITAAKVENLARRAESLAQRAARAMPTATTTTMMTMTTIIPTTLRTILLQGPCLTTLLSHTTLPVMTMTGVTQAAQEAIVRVNTTTTTGIGSTFLDLLLPVPSPATQPKVERPRVVNQDRRVASLGLRVGRATHTGIITTMMMMIITTVMGTHHITALGTDPDTTLDTTLGATMVMTTGVTVTHHIQDTAMMTTGVTQVHTRLGRVVTATMYVDGLSRHISPVP